MRRILLLVLVTLAAIGAGMSLAGTAGRGRDLLDEPFSPTRRQWVELVCRAYSDPEHLTKHEICSVFLEFEATTRILESTYFVVLDEAPDVSVCAFGAYRANGRLKAVLPMVRAADPTITGHIRGIWCPPEGSPKVLPKVEPLAPRGSLGGVR